MNHFATIKVRQKLRRWLKLEAAKQEVPMYQLLEQLVVQASGGVEPWSEQPSEPSEPS